MAIAATTTADLIRNQLRRLRLAAGLSQEEFGRRVHYSASMVSAVEVGQRPLDRAFLTRADEVLESGDLLVALFELAKRDGQPSWFRPWLDAEGSATQLRSFQPSLVPGLLQTAGYARVILRSGNVRITEGELDRRVAARLDRQEILAREEPPQFLAVIDESALRRIGEGFDKVMVEQLTHLVACARKPHISIHVVPAEAVLHIGLSGPFVLAQSVEGGWIGHLEHQLGGVVVDNDDELSTLHERWESVRNEALTARQSVEFLEELVKPWT